MKNKQMSDFIYRYWGYCFWKIIIAITAIRFPGENKFSGLKQKHGTLYKQNAQIDFKIGL